MHEDERWHSVMLRSKLSATAYRLENLDSDLRWLLELSIIEQELVDDPRIWSPDGRVVVFSLVFGWLAKFDNAKIPSY